MSIQADISKLKEKNKHYLQAEIFIAGSQEEVGEVVDKPRHKANYEPNTRRVKPHTTEERREHIIYMQSVGSSILC